MRRILFGITAVLFLAVLSGCNEENVTGPKQSRLLALENTELKTELANCQKMIETRKDQLAACEKDKAEQIKKTEEVYTELIDFVMEDNQKTTEENKELKAKLESLQK